MNSSPLGKPYKFVDLRMKTFIIFAKVFNSEFKDQNDLVIFSKTLSIEMKYLNLSNKYLKNKIKLLVDNPTTNIF